jgi:hypothetical protein
LAALQSGRVKTVPHYAGCERHNTVGLGAPIEQMVTLAKGYYRVFIVIEFAIKLAASFFEMIAESICAD